MRLVKVEILLKAALRLFKIGSCLIDGEWEVIECLDNVSSPMDLVDLFIGHVFKIESMFNAMCSAKEKQCSFDEPHRFDFDGGCQRTNGAGACGEKNASAAPLGKILPNGGKVTV